MLEQEPIRQLLRRLGLEPKDMPPVAPAAWHMAVKYPAEESDVFISVACLPGESGYLSIQAALGVSGQHRTALVGLPEPDYRRLRFDIFRDLLQSGRAQYVAKVNTTDTRLESVTFARRLWPDDVSVSSLDYALQGVYDALLLARMRIRVAVGEAP